MTTQNPKTDDLEQMPSNREKDPDDWVTGDERMTGAQASYLKTLCEEAGEEFDPELTKAAASKRIDELQNPRTADGEQTPSNREKDPDDWVTGDQRMTGAQASYLKTLCEEAKEEFDPELSKAAASKRIDELQKVTGRGVPAGDT